MALGSQNPLSALKPSTLYKPIICFLIQCGWILIQEVICWVKLLDVCGRWQTWNAKKKKRHETETSIRPLWGCKWNIRALFLNTKTKIDSDYQINQYINQKIGRIRTYKYDPIAWNMETKCFSLRHENQDKIWKINKQQIISCSFNHHTANRPQINK